MSFDNAIPPSDACFRLAMAASGIGMAIVDLGGRWREVNPAIERMLGYDSAALVGHPTAEFTHPEDVPQAQSQLQDLLAGRLALVDAPCRYLHRNGDVVWLQANIAVMRSPAGEPLYLVTQLRDIGAERAAAAVLRESAAQRADALDAVNRQLQLFADTVSHDLRAPLRSIESFAGLLADRLGDSIDATSQDYLARVRNAAARMSSLLAALAELSQVTRAELRPAMVDLSLLAEWAVAELQEAEPVRAADVVVQPGLTAWGDERLLKLLLGHLLDNAWKFSRDCDRVRIRVSGHTDAAGALCLRVVDAGCGFDTRYAHKLFEPFQRLHGPDQGGGHGLGLAIAQRIAERHHGRLSAESTPEGGSSFELELPAAPPDVAATSRTE